jgi:hypothetical protein
VYAYWYCVAEMISVSYKIYVPKYMEIYVTHPTKPVFSDNVTKSRKRRCKFNVRDDVVARCWHVRLPSIRKHAIERNLSDVSQ